MTEQEIKHKSAFDVFASQQETFEEAQKKSSEESRKRTEFFRFSQDGTFSVRILPLAPVIDSEGNPLPLERKGYEYPLRSLMLKIENPAKLDKKGNPTIQFATVCNAKQAFKNLKEDLIDAYVRVASDKYADDESLIKKLRAGSFEGGLKWDNHRCMYIFDLENRTKGIQLLQLSFSQYKELESAKLSAWGKLLKKNAKVNCPISSISDAYPVEVERKTENKKVSYTFRVDILSGNDELAEEELQSLLDMPRIPETIYRYSRYHLEATIAYLTQLDEKFGINVMGEEDIKEVIDTIKMLIPSEDTSHFTIGGKSGENSDDNNAEDTLDSLWGRWDNLDEQDLDDKSSEGAELRADIKQFIDDNNIDVQVKRGKTNHDLLKEIDEAMGVSTSDADADDDEEEEQPAPKTSRKAEAKEEPEDNDEEDDEDAEPATPSADEGDDEPEDESEEPARPTRNRRERNDDTNEPAARPERERRASRPRRRR